MAGETNAPSSRRAFFTLIGFLLLVFAILFHKSFNPDLIHFANDGPIGALIEKRSDAFHALTGWWEPRNWLGYEIPPGQPALDLTFFLAVGRLAFTKFIVPFSLLFLGVSAWIFFRRLNFSPFVCLICSTAAALNMNYFSNSCWGQYSRAFTLSMAFLALAALQSSLRDRKWVKTILAGFAVGAGIIHGFDVGALFSLCIAAFAVFVEIADDREKVPTRIFKGGLRVALMAAFAAFIAAHTLVSLINTQIKGVVVAKQDPQSKRQNWDFATQWSTPKIETLRVIIPGLFGYRMDTKEGGEYWGRVGQPEGNPTFRFNGSGEYAGIFVVLVSTLAIAQGFRKKGGILSPPERKAVWFWSALGLVTLLLAFGRYAPFYQLFYALPYASTIRNPMKFMHLFHMALLILFGYGLECLWRQYLSPSLPKTSSVTAQVKKWWSGVSADKSWFTYICLGGVVVSVLGFLLYSSSRREVIAYLERSGFASPLSTTTANFSLHEVGWYLFFLILSVALIGLILSGWFSGARAKWAFIFIAGLLAIDLGRANSYWILYWNYKYKYETNPIIEILRDKPYEHRVTMAPFNIPQLSDLQQLHGIEWHQHHFLYYNIQSLDVIQSPRVGSEDFDFKQTFNTPAGILRQWELTNTRFVLGPGGEVIEALNQQLDPAKRRFRLHTGFEIVPKPGVEVHDLQDLTAMVKPDGKLGLIEFTGALPRTKLYSNWQVITNDELITTNGASVTTNSVTLHRLNSADFDPHQTVLISGQTPITASSATNQEPGTVEITSYETKRVELNANSKTPSVLLLNDKYNPNWKVAVDGQSAPLLRCNYVMRGVYLQPGTHKITFTYQPVVTALYITVAALILAIGLIIFVALPTRQLQKI